MSAGPTVVTVRARTAHALVQAAARTAEALKRTSSGERVLVVYQAKAASLYADPPRPVIDPKLRAARGRRAEVLT